MTKIIQQSLCWDCKNAYANKCKWIRNFKHTWDEADILCIQYKNRTGVVYRVKKCKNFIPEEGISEEQLRWNTNRELLKLQTR